MFSSSYQEVPATLVTMATRSMALDARATKASRNQGKIFHQIALNLIVI